LRAELPPLPVPLTLPPSLIETFPINSSVSYVGDAVRIVDCPLDSDLPLGLCSNLLYGGNAMWDTPLTGNVTITFNKPTYNSYGDPLSVFTIQHPGKLTGPNTIMTAPQIYQKTVRNIFILDALDNVSTGTLNLNTGEITNFSYNVLVSTSWYTDLVTVNPKLQPPDFQFPGAYGSAQIVFTQRTDGNLDVTMTGSTFLPLGKDTLGDPVRMPLPYCGPNTQCFGIQAPGSSLHPHIYWTTAAQPLPSCGTNCQATIPSNQIQMYTAHSYYTSFGDHFLVNIPQLGGEGDGRTHLQGRYQLQFGPVNGNRVPIHVGTLPPLGLFVDLPAAPAPLSTFPIRMFGHDEFLTFPSGLIYVTADPALLEDIFDFGVGSLDIPSGQFVSGLVYRGVPAQSLFTQIIDLNITTIPLSTFRHRGPAYLLAGHNGQNIFGYNGLYQTSFDGYQFPYTDYTKPDLAYTAGPGSLLHPFMRFQGVAPNGDVPTATMTSSATGLVSSFKQVFDYSYSVSCNPSVPTGQFDYTNYDLSSSGGKYHMEDVVAVVCSNSKFSTSPPGSYDTVSFTGYGTWSKDPTQGRHIVTVHTSSEPGSPFYLSIQVDGDLSKVELKPPADTIP
jgi:hypothetical protein